jgi:transposase
VEQITGDAEVVARVAALDIGKATLTACVRVPDEDHPGRCRQQVRTFTTMTPALLELRDWLICQSVTLCVMEATSVYWKPPFYLLEDAVECWVVNARDVKNVPGRPKTDRLDAIWLAKLAERGMLRPASSRRPGSGSCGICAATGAPWSRNGPGKSSGRKNCWRTPRSSCRR